MKPKSQKLTSLTKSRTVILTPQKNLITETQGPREQNILDRRGRKNKKLASSNKLSRRPNREPKNSKSKKSKDKKILNKSKNSKFKDKKNWSKNKKIWSSRDKEKPRGMNCRDS